MAQRDKNRFRKIYPFKRILPKNFTLASDLTAFTEAGAITFTATNTGTHTFSTSFPAVPIVVVTSVDSADNQQANVQTFITAVSTTSVTIETSAPFTGQVNFLAEYVVN